MEEYIPWFDGRQAKPKGLTHSGERERFVDWAKTNLPYDIKYQHMLDDHERYRQVDAWVEQTLHGSWAVVKVGLFSGVVYYFERNSDRLLFKLKWGGSERGLNQEENDYITKLLWDR